MNILAIDVGGTHIKFLASGQAAPRKFPSGPTMSAAEMVAGVKSRIGDWKFDVASIGYPAPVLKGKPAEEPINLGTGWVDYDFEAELGCPVKVINDAAMQAIGSYQQGKMLFLGLGTGLGTAMVFRGGVEPMELGHLPYRKRTFEDYVGVRGLERFGKKKWRRLVFDVVRLLDSALLPDEIVLGGGNTKHLEELPPKCRRGDNANAFQGGFRLWNEPGLAEPVVRATDPK